MSLSVLGRCYIQQQHLIIIAPLFKIPRLKKSDQTETLLVVPYGTAEELSTGGGGEYHNQEMQ